MRLDLLLVCAAAACCAACGTADADLSLPAPIGLEPPAGAGAAQPFAAAAPGGGVTLSWTEPAGDGHALRFAHWDGETWGAPGTAAEGTDWFVNWADFPSVVHAGDVMVAHWLQRSGPGRYSYDVMITQSADGGRSWAPPQRPHRDGTETEHGFVTLFPHNAPPAAAGAGAAPHGAVGVVWLDGRRYEDGPEGPASREMQVRFTSFGGAAFDSAAWAAEYVLDDRACDCCQTAVALPRTGPVVFYRDRSPDEVRDISVARLVDGAWTPPQRVHADDWTINACPVNGPAADADGDDVVVAWFTAAADTPRVRLGWSRDSGATWGAPVAIDDGHPIGRVDVLLLDAGTALVVWLERVGDDAEVRGRLVTRDGRRGPAATLAATTAGRSGGFPRMARSGSDVLLAWTEPGDASRVHAALLPLARR